MTQQDKVVLLKGATPEQKKAINYFCPNTGCLGFLGKVSDADYDTLVEEMVKNANTMKKAIDKIGMDESDLQEIPPVTLVGYEDSKYETQTATGAYRSNLYTVTHLFFSDSQVFMYTITFDTVKNNKKERTEEYFYKDITNFSTTTDSKEVFYMTGGCTPKQKRTNIELQKFALIVPGDKFTCATWGDIEDQVKAMKNKLREKKA